MTDFHETRSIAWRTTAEMLGLTMTDVVSGTPSSATFLRGDKSWAAVTATAMSLSASDRLLGRDSAGAGAAEELTVGGGIEFTGTGGIQTSAFTGDVTKGAGSTATTLAISGAIGKLMQHNGSAWAQSTPAWPTAAPAAGTFPRGDGTNFVTSTLTLPNTLTANQVLYGTGTNVVGGSANLTYDGTTFKVTGAGTASAVSIRVENSSNLAVLRTQDNGFVRFGNDAVGPVLFPFSGLTFSTPNLAGRGLTIYGYAQSGSHSKIAFAGDPITNTSGDISVVRFATTFSPTSGVATNTDFFIASTINQTGGASGITRGIYVNPTLTAAADYRGLQVDAAITAATNYAGIVVNGETVPTNSTNLLLGTITIPAGVYSIHNASIGQNVHAGSSFFGGTTPPDALVHIAAGTAAAKTAPLQVNVGTSETTARSGILQFSSASSSGIQAPNGSRWTLVESDTTERYVVQAATSVKTTAGAPYANDGYVTLTVNGTAINVMTTA